MKSAQRMHDLGPMVRVIRRVHPAVSLQLRGPFKKSAWTRGPGEMLEHGDVETVSAEDARGFLDLVAGPQADDLGAMGLEVIGMYNARLRQFEIRWVLSRASGYYRLSVHYTPGTDLGRLAARYYGYPECCASSRSIPMFLHGFKDSPLAGTGFVPCLVCHTEKTPAALKREIAARRICPTSFPRARVVHDTILTVQAIVQGRLAVT